MRAASFALASLPFVYAFVGACGGGGESQAYATFQACFDDHTMKESLSTSEAIVVCCIDHPIGGKKDTVCGTTSADCVTYLTANLTGPTSAELMSACDDYVTQNGM